jgi:hypothetical protein
LIRLRLPPILLTRVQAAIRRIDIGSGSGNENQA